MKTCTRCRLPKSLSEFSKDITHGDGHKSRCKECISAVRPKAQRGSITPIKAPLSEEEQKRRYAQREAAKRLIEKHMLEYRALVREELSALGAKPKWVQVS